MGQKNSIPKALRNAGVTQDTLTVCSKIRDVYRHSQRLVLSLFELSSLLEVSLSSEKMRDELESLFLSWSSTKKKIHWLYDAYSRILHYYEDTPDQSPGNYYTKIDSESSEEYLPMLTPSHELIRRFYFVAEQIRGTMLHLNLWFRVKNS